MNSFDFKTKPIGEFLRQKAEVSPKVLFTAESKFHNTPFFRVAYFYKALNKEQFQGQFRVSPPQDAVKRK